MRLTFGYKGHFFVCKCSDKLKLPVEIGWGIKAVIKNITCFADTTDCWACNQRVCVSAVCRSSQRPLSLRQKMEQTQDWFCLQQWQHKQMSLTLDMMPLSCQSNIFHFFSTWIRSQYSAIPCESLLRMVYFVCLVH